MIDYTVLPKQSLFDIAVECYGDVQGVVQILQDNPEIVGPTGPLEAGQLIKIREEKINARAANSLKDHAPFQTIGAEDMPKGIGFWKLKDYVIE